MTRRRLMDDRETTGCTPGPRRLLPAAAALLFTLAGMGTALADIPEPPPADDDDDEDVTGTCLPEKQPGDDCRLPNGDEGVCQEDTEPCGFDGGGTIYCHVCEEEGCSIAGVGMSSAPGASWLAISALAALGLATRRRRR